MSSEGLQSMISRTKSSSESRCNVGMHSLSNLHNEASRQFSPSELRALGQAAHLETGLRGLCTTLNEYLRLAKEVLPAGQDVVDALQGLLSVANSKLTVMVVGECGSGRSAVVNACIKQQIVRGSSHATVRYNHSRSAKELIYQKIHHIRDYLRVEPCNFFEFESLAYSQLGMLPSKADSVAEQPALGVSGALFEDLKSEVRDLVTLVDSGPGVTVHGTTSLADTLTKEVDAVVLLLDATCFTAEFAPQVGTWIKQAKKAVGESGLFVVWNKCDLLSENLVQEQVQQFHCAATELCADYGVAPERVFFTSATDAAAKRASPGAAQLRDLWTSLQRYVVQEGHRRESLIHTQLQPHREVLDFWRFLASGGSQSLTTYYYLLCKAVTGAAGLQGADTLAAPLAHLSRDELLKATEQLIYMQAAVTFSSGFLTGLGGFITMPIAVPTALAAAYIIRFRLCLAIALLAHHDMLSPRTITAVFLSVFTDDPNRILKFKMPSDQELSTFPSDLEHAAEGEADHGENTSSQSNLSQQQQQQQQQQQVSTSRELPPQAGHDDTRAPRLDSATYNSTSEVQLEGSPEDSSVQTGDSVGGAAAHDVRPVGPGEADPDAQPEHALQHNAEAIALTKAQKVYQWYLKTHLQAPVVACAPADSPSSADPSPSAGAQKQSVGSVPNPSNEDPKKVDSDAGVDACNADALEDLHGMENIMLGEPAESGAEEAGLPPADSAAEDESRTTQAAGRIETDQHEDREGHSKALEAARRAYTLALPVALVAKSKMTLQSGANAMFYAAEIIPVVGGVVSGGSDGMLTVRAGRVAKNAFLRVDEQTNLVEEDPVVLLREEDVHHAVNQSIAVDRLEHSGSSMTSVEAMNQVGEMGQQAADILGVAADVAVVNAAVVAQEVSARAKEVSEKMPEVLSKWWNRTTVWAEQVMKTSAEHLHSKDDLLELDGTEDDDDDAGVCSPSHQSQFPAKHSPVTAHHDNGSSRTSEEHVTKPLSELLDS